ncbi:MAG: tetratricopeptide repeat protein [Actinobacteria bacterium]|nr:tetratricopeptide repeat protein [Actinomycetota bacterium]
MTTQDRGDLALPDEAPAPWASFVPDHVAGHLGHRATSPVGWERRFEAAVLFVDISGFTPMSEQLGKHGPMGTEELSAILNNYFGPMVDLIRSFGGDIAKFGGDSLTVLFPYTGSTKGTVVRRAIQCAHDMLDAMRSYRTIPTHAGVFSLSIKAGLAAGPVLSTVVGDPHLRLDHVAAGRTLDIAAAAEHHADPGELWADPEALRAAGPVRVLEDRDGFASLGRPLKRARHAGRQSKSSQSHPVPAAFVHPAIAELLRAGRTGFLAEHRHVTIMFVSFDGPDYDNDPNSASILQEYLCSVIHVVERYDGHFAQTDMGDKGSKFLALFGAPITHEDDVTRALLCALELKGLGQGAIRCGVNSGLVFCGPLGSSTRQEYAVIGDSVNLSARLMQLAGPGEIVVGPATQKLSGGAFDLEPRDLVRVKGKEQPVATHLLRGPKGHPSTRPVQTVLPFVGRRHQLSLASATTERAVQGEGQIIALSGEAGIGKTRLCAEITEASRRLGADVLNGACQSYGTRSGYLVWRTVWRSLLRIDEGGSLQEQVNRIQMRLAEIDPLLLPRLPLLRAVLDIRIQDNETIRSMGAELRSEALKDLLLQILRHAAATRPLLVVLEDCHWIDPVSQELLAFLGRNIVNVPVAMIVLHRWPSQDKDPLTGLREWPHLTQITLAELEPNDVRALVDAKLDDLFGTEHEPFPEMTERVTKQGQGNPFYIEELLNFIRAEGAGGQPDRTPELPASLHALIMARIDQLSEGQRTTLKVASVIGRTFRSRWIWNSYPPAGSPRVVARQLEELERARMMSLHARKPEMEYLFRHAIGHEVAYNSLTFAMRATLHEQIAGFIEQAYASDLGGYVDILAHHFSHTKNKPKQRHYYRSAADRAKVIFNNEVALDFYQRLLLLVDDAERSGVLRNLGQVYQLVGRWDAAARTYRDALDLAREKEDAVGLAEAQCALGYLMTFTATYRDALELLEQAGRGFAEAGVDEGEARTLEYMSHTYFHLADYGGALDHARRHLAIALRLGDKRAASDALENMGRAHWHRGKHDSGLRCLHEALDAATDIGYDRGMVHACNDIAGLYAELGKTEQALTYLHEALEVANRTGYRLLLGMSTGNAGILYRNQGDHGRALDCLLYSLESGVEMGDRPGVVNGLTELALLMSDRGRFQEAETLFDTATRFGRELASPHFLCFCLQHYAELLDSQGRHLESQPLAVEALDIATRVEDSEVRFGAEVLVIRLDTALGRITTEVATERFRSLLAQGGQAHEQAALHYELWRLTGDEPSGRQAAALYGELHQSTCNVFYSSRRSEITGEPSPDPRPLPPLPAALMGRRKEDLDALLQKAGLLYPGA